MKDQLKAPARPPPPVKPGDFIMNVDTAGLVLAAQTMDRLVQQLTEFAQQQLTMQQTFLTTSERLLTDLQACVGKMAQMQMASMDVPMPTKLGTRSYDVKLREGIDGATTGFRIVARDS